MMLKPKYKHFFNKQRNLFIFLILQTPQIDNACAKHIHASFSAPSLYFPLPLLFAPLLSSFYKRPCFCRLLLKEKEKVYISIGVPST